MRRTAFATAGLIALLLTAPAPAKDWVQHYWDRCAAFKIENAALPKGKRHVVLLGSSSMEGWKYKKRVGRFLPKSKDRVLNRGITADRIGRGKRGILNRLDDSVFDCQPSHVFLMNGRNDMGKSKKPPVKRIAATYRKVIEAIQKRDPKVVVCVVTAPPVNKGYSVMAPHLVEYNKALKTIAKDLGCPLIDLHGLLVGKDGLLPLTHTSDGLHFNDKGYALLGQHIEAVVAKAAKKKRKKRRS